MRVIEVKNAEFLPHVRQLIGEGHTVTINVRGYSMRPFLENGCDSVILAAVDNPQVGDAVLAEIMRGKYVLHRIVRIEGERLTLMGDGNMRGTEQCLKSDVVGRVTHYIYPAEKLAPRVVRWRRLRFMRRLLLVLYKITYQLPIRNKPLKR